MENNCGCKKCNHPAKMKMKLYGFIAIYVIVFSTVAFFAFRK